MPVGTNMPSIIVVVFLSQLLLSTAQILDSDIKVLSPEARSLLGFSDVRLSSSANCKVFPGDDAWPPDAAWDILNKTTSSALIKTIPIGAPCYPGPLYNNETCALITANWSDSSVHMADPTSMMSPLWQGRTCEPPELFPSTSGSCTLGGYPSYVINATSIPAIQFGVNFARNNNLRLIIKNTGHDFLGKSGGAGSLSIWTHHLKDIEFISDFIGDREGDYRGAAFKAGSGVQAWEIYQAANKKGMVVVGGEGRTVGVMGGYIQGGGHSPLSSIHGIAADHVLEMEVVLASGRYIKASASKHAEVFWALRGGGGSTFGVVTSVTVKAHPDLAVTALTFAFPPTITYETFWAGVRSYFEYFLTFADAGTYAYFFIFPATIPGGTPTFLMQPFFAPNMSIAKTQSLLAPWFSELSGLGINITSQFNHYSNFLDAWSSRFPQEAIGRDASTFGSRLFPRHNWSNATVLNATFNAFKDSVDAGLVMINFNMRTQVQSSGNGDNAVNPAWRPSVMHAIQTVTWAENATDSEILAQRAVLTARESAWRDVSPGAGAYLGEADRDEVDFQQSFWGTNYPRLLEIKKSVDPEQLFWAKTGVGSEGWAVRTRGVVGDENGRLCRV